MSYILYNLGYGVIIVQQPEQVINKMQIVSFTQARNGLKSVLDRVVNDADCTIITRRDSADAIVMSFEYYSSLMETVHLLKSPANAEHIRRSIEQFNHGIVQERELVE